MDSMRSLSGSLPRSSPHHTRRPAPSDLLQAFRSAALSVTQLYKTATTDLEESRAAGYQDALDDLLIFLDRENLGLGDGEGWKVRQWATERLLPAMPGTDSDGELEEAGERAQSESPTTQARADEVSNANTSTIIPPPRPDSAPLPSVQQPSVPQETTSTQYPGMFRFQESTSLPDDIEMDPLSSSPASAYKLDVIPSRGIRSSNRQSAHDRKSPVRLSQSLGYGAGTKRKSASTFNDFFDVSLLGNTGKEGYGGGGKRGRLA